MDEKEKMEDIPKAPTPEMPAAPSQPAGVPTGSTVSGVNGPMPAELHGWNWGAFCLSWIWGIGNRTYISFLMFLSPLNFIMPFVLGAKGNEWAWKNRKFESVAQFRATQKAWTIWGLSILGFSILMIIIFWKIIIIPFVIMYLMITAQPGQW